jgi:hypothetical protein
MSIKFLRDAKYSMKLDEILHNCRLAPVFDKSSLIRAESTGEMNRERPIQGAPG